MRRMHTDEEILSLIPKHVPNYEHQIQARAGNITIWFHIITRDKTEWTKNNFFSKMEDYCDWPSSGGILCRYKNTSVNTTYSYPATIGWYDDALTIFTNTTDKGTSFNFLST